MKTVARSAGARAYQRRTLGGSIAFGAMLLLMHGLRRHGDMVALSWLPLLPLAYCVHAWLRHLPTLDELEQRIELNALAWAASISIALCTWLFSLQSAKVLALDGIDALAIALACPCAVYAAARLLINRRYR